MHQLGRSALFICFTHSPTLTWRDVQHLVVRASRRSNLRAEDWAMNGVGRYGEGFRGLLSDNLVTSRGPFVLRYSLKSLYKLPRKLWLCIIVIHSITLVLNIYGNKMSVSSAC